MDLWKNLSHLFESNDGSLPDIHINNITIEDVVKIYSWVLALTTPSANSFLWSLEEKRDVQISELDNPSMYLLEGRSEPFRHCLELFTFNSVLIPQLSIFIDNSSIQFDYRMGKEWTHKEVNALFEFLCQIKDIVPNARVFQTYEGDYDKPNREFSNAFDIVYIEHCKFNQAI
jgi:hypothetical protein